MRKWLDATSNLGLLAAGFAGGCLFSYWSCQIRRAAQSAAISEGSSEGRRLVSIAVHGGAYAIPDGIAEASVKGVSKAAAIGYEILLLRGGSALEAVEAAVRELELNPAFDAGVGVEHPVTAARLVMQETNHVICHQHGGNHSITAKKKGRCGDSPIVGSGGYAADGLGAVSTTGHGEAIMKVVLAHRILAEHARAGSEGGQEVGGFQRRVEQGLEYMKARVNGYGGIIGADGQGRVGMAHHTTKRVAWAKAEQRRGGAVSAGLTL
ncbi:hypothetical protein CYMTET_53510 [Cymbomonas tetramitiformis]|uniref:Asparaginase n=1 Tax=Cymbomonas tetramitiformis TaxID=36881 RepID=A0AAE0BGQ7_9CHLO|nr:hypothetical protein CYMTET_53510 [Cymbomonas tetramitiformis]